MNQSSCLRVWGEATCDGFLFACRLPRFACADAFIAELCAQASPVEVCVCDMNCSPHEAVGVVLSGTYPTCICASCGASRTEADMRGHAVQACADCLEHVCEF
jgi:hypothetical protein